MLIIMQFTPIPSTIDVTGFKPMISRPGAPHDTVDGANELNGLKIDSAFIGSCTNGEDGGSS